MQWGPIEFHRKSLQNLEIAMQKTCKLCAVMLDTLGREIFVRRAFQIGPDGWPVHDASFDIQAGQKVTLTTNPDATATAELLPVNYPGLVGAPPATTCRCVWRTRVVADTRATYVCAGRV